MYEYGGEKGRGMEVLRDENEDFMGFLKLYWCSLNMEHDATLSFNNGLLLPPKKIQSFHP